MPSRIQVLPTRDEFLAALPGLAVVVLPLILVSEAVYWVELAYSEPLLHTAPPLIPLMVAAILSIIVTNLFDLPPRYQPGLQFSTRWLLRAGIVLYGLNFTYNLWFRPDAAWIFLIGLLAVAVPLLVAYVAGKALHLDESPSMLVAIGTAICGISAIAATQQATGSDEKDAGLSIATILLFGTFVLFAYPVVESFLRLSSVAYGTWTGATTLDLPQLVAAALQGGGSSSLPSALWVKSIRIGLLVPVILVLVTLRGRSAGGLRFREALRSFPIFILVFFGVILIGTVVAIPQSFLGPVANGQGEYLNLSAAGLLLSSAIIGICFRVKREFVGSSGWKFVAVGGLAWALQSVVVLWLATTLPLPT